MARTDLPTGTVTFLFTDVEGSTRLLHDLGAEGYAAALAEHRTVVREACARHGGVEVDTQGDAFFFAFPTAPGALAAAEAFTEALSRGDVRVRAGVHTGAPLVTGEGYVGEDVHAAARIAAAGHGGQVLVSSSSATLLDRELTDLGEHRFKDLAEPIPVFQLGEDAFPPLKTISNTNLPRPASSFVGRERELQEVLARIRDGARLLTLTGPGGSGKTRLALEAATTLVPEYKAGVFWVGLATLRDPELVSETIAQTLGAKDGLAEHIGERELLLLLDNLEQVIEAAPELSALLTVCPNLTLLATSRELLRVQGEVEYPVPPLVQPEAVALFCQRSQLEPSETIAELCARLDNLPLALELAAARTRVLTPEQVLERLSHRLDLLKGGRDADPRQQTLRATIEWSYELLSAEEQELFARLSVFAGGCTLEAAEHVCGADLDTLQSLLEKSLLRFTNGRYWMLETIREYAAARIVESGEVQEVEALHAAYFLGLAESQALPGSYVVSSEAVQELNPENDNLRAALGAAVARDDMSFVARALGTLWSIMLATGYAREGVMWSRRVLARRDDLSLDDLERVLVAGSELMRFMGELDAAEELKLELLDRARAGEGRWLTATLADLSDIAFERGDTERARAYAEESLALGGGIRALHSLAEVELRAGDLAAAARHFEECAKGWEGVHAFNQAWSLESLGETARRQGDRERAAGLFRRAAQQFARLGDQASAGDCLDGLAALALEAQDRERAGVLAGAAERLRDEWGRPVLRPERAVEDVAEAALARGRRMSFDEALEYALANID